MIELNQNVSSTQPDAHIAVSLRQGPSFATTLGNNQTALGIQPASTPPLQQAKQEFNKAIMRAAQYEANIENIIRDKVNRLFPTADKVLKENIVAQSVEKVAEANQALEFNHLGNDLLEFPAVEYMAMSFARRVLELVAIDQTNYPPKQIENNDEGGIGFLKGWSKEGAEWAEQMNTLLNGDKINARVLTTLAYSFKGMSRFPQRMHKMGKSINQQLLANKESNPRVNIFVDRGAGSEPAIEAPITVQPHGWAWLKYFEWNVAGTLGIKGPTNFIGDRPEKDPHWGNKFKFEGMAQAIKPPLYSRDAFSLSETPDFKSGYSNYIINDQSLSSIGTDQELKVNWYQQNMEKKLPMFTGPSSTTSHMYEFARLMNLPAAEAQPFRALLLGWMIQARDHSFTEIMGALDAYAMEFAENGPAIVASDEKMAWRARQTGDWLEAYENLFTEDIDLPAMEAKTIILYGQKISLPALKPVNISRKEFDQFITHGKGYPSQYASDDYLRKLGQAIESGQEVEDVSGLASERILYAPQNRENLQLYNPKLRKILERPDRTASGTPLLDAKTDAAVTAWLDTLPSDQRAQLLNSAASLLAESTQADALSYVWNYGGRHDVWETFVTVAGTNMLAGKLRLDSLKAGEDPFYHLLDIAEAENTPSKRKAAILAAIGDLKDNQDILIKGMLLAVSRFYTGEGTEIINPGYGDFAPPKDDAEMEVLLQSVLRQKSYTTKSQRAQAISERNQTVELLHAALESPMFERYYGTVWHGSHPVVADALLKKGNGVQFPGFMSTTKDPGQAVGFMVKGALLVVNAEEMGGALLKGISNAPGEEEILIPAGTSFKVEQSYTLHIDKIKPPEELSAIKKRIFMMQNANKVTVRVTTPEMDRAGVTDQSDPEGEDKLKPLIDVIKEKRTDLEPKTLVVILSPESQAEELYEEEEQEMQETPQIETVARPLQMLAR